MSLKIGGAKAPAKAATPGSSKAATPVSSKPGTPTPAVAAAKTASAKSEAAKADVAKEVAKQKEETAKTSDALLAEVKASADEETLEDLYGKDEEGAFFRGEEGGEELTILGVRSDEGYQASSQHRLHRTRRCWKVDDGRQHPFPLRHGRQADDGEVRAGGKGGRARELVPQLGTRFDCSGAREGAFSFFQPRGDHPLMSLNAGQDGRSRSRLL